MPDHLQTGAGRQQDEADSLWLENPPILGFRESDAGRNDGAERILVWRPRDPLWTELAVKILQKFNLEAYGCSIDRSFADHFFSGFYAVLITGLQDNEDFIRKIHSRDPSMQIIVATGHLVGPNPAAIDYGLHQVKGLHVSVLMPLPSIPDTLSKVIRNIAFPRYWLNFIPGDEDVHVCLDGDFE